MKRAVPSTNPIRIVLADDHTIVRAGIRMVLEKIKRVEVVAEASDGHEVLEMVRRHRPDVLITDIAMPHLNGIEAAARIARELPELRVIILSMYATQEHVHQAIRAGVAGYVVKESAPAELELALRAVADGKTYLSPIISHQVVASYREQLGEAEHPLLVLTSRQREVLQMLAEGRTAKEIARALSLSVKSVENHRMNIMNRLNIHDLPGLVRFAIRHGLVTPET